MRLAANEYKILVVSRITEDPGGFAPPDPPSPSLAGPLRPAPLRRGAPVAGPAPPSPPTSPLALWAGLRPGASPRRTPHRRRSRGPYAPLRSGWARLWRA